MRQKTKQNKKQQNLQLLDILACNSHDSADKPPFQNLTKNLFARFTSMEHWSKRLFVGFLKDGLLAELQTRMSRSRRFCCFLPRYIASTAPFTFLWKSCVYSKSFECKSTTDYLHLAIVLVCEGINRLPCLYALVLVF